MFSHQESLAERIDRVSARLRSIRFWWSLAIIAGLAAAGLLLLERLQPSAVWTRRELIGVVLVGVMAATLIAMLVARFSYRNRRKLALRIEQRFPSLNQRLLTALSIPQPAVGQPLGYLQQEVIRDAYRHSQTHAWTQVVSPWQAISSRLLGIIAIAALAMMAIQAKSPADPYLSSLTIPQRDLDQAVVEPGDAEVERGTSLVISAKFLLLSGTDKERLPQNVTLHIHPQNPAVSTSDAPVAPSDETLPMRKNLDDPIYSAFLPSISSDFTYSVSTPQWQSDRYQLKTFEYPALVKATALLSYPEYTKLPEKRIEDTLKVSAIEGTRLQWDLQLNKQVARIQVIDSEGELLTASKIDSTETPESYQFAVTLSKSTKWQIELIDTQGRKNREPITLSATALPNKAPMLKMTSGGDLVASPIEEVTLTATARDDFQVIRAGIGYSLAGGDMVEQELVMPETDATDPSLNYLLELESLQAEADNLVAYYFWAEDFAADGSVRRTQSDLFFIEVRPFDEIFREGEGQPGGQSQAQSQGQQPSSAEQSEELIELQKQIIAATWKVKREQAFKSDKAKLVEDIDVIKDSQLQALELAGEMSGELADAKSVQLGQKLETQIQSAIAELRESSARAEVDTLSKALASEQAAYQTLLQLRAHEFQVSRSQQQQSSSSSSRSESNRQRQQQIDALELENDENRYETQSQAQEAPDQEAQREQRQILSRLQELAKRQEDINEQLKQLQSALEQAQTEAEKEEVRRQLKRLRDQQQEMLRESDEVAERMQSAENREQMQTESEKLEEARERLRQSSEALAQENSSQALAAGTRAERELNELSEEFRKRASGQFNETMRELRQQGRELEQSQQKLSERLSQLNQNENSAGLRTSVDREQLAEKLTEERQRTEKLMENVQSTVQDAEESEPLLAQSLYEVFQESKRSRLDQQLEETAELLEHGFDAQAQAQQQQSLESTTKIREGLDRAAESILGDETKALESALSTLDQLQRSLDQEMQAARGEGESPQGEPSSQSGQPSGQPQGQSGQQGERGQEESGMSESQSGEGNGQPSEESSEPAGQSSGGSPENGQPNSQQPNESQLRDESQQPDGQQGQQGEGQRGEGQQGQPGESTNSTMNQSQPGQGRSSGEPSQNQEPSPGENQGQGAGLRSGSEPTQNSQGGRMAGGAVNEAIQSPMTGEGFREWSDAMRDVEEMVGEPDLRSEAATIRDRARQMRVESRRHSQPPKWTEVEKMVAEPLRELRMKVNEELMRRAADRTDPVPIDRDPVPDQFSDAVKRYYERLGSGR